MKKLSEILNEANQSSVIVETVDAPDKPNPFTIKYMELLEGFGVKSITELDGDRFEEFHAKAMQAIKEDKPAED